MAAALHAKIKETKIILRNIYYPPQSKNSISLEVREETKLLPDSAFGNFLCTRGYKPKSEKKLSFLALKLSYSSGGDPKWTQVCKKP